jgi:uncharacterized protein YggE
MAARTPPSISIPLQPKFTFQRKDSREKLDTPLAVSVAVDEALADGEIDKAQQIYDNALDEGVFAALSCSYKTWSNEVSANEGLQSAIENAISSARAAKAIRVKKEPSVQVDPTKKV